MKTTIRECCHCGKTGPIADDQTDPSADEMALDTKGVICPIGQPDYICGECMETAQDAARMGRPVKPLPFAGQA